MMDSQFDEELATMSLQLEITIPRADSTSELKRAAEEVRLRSDEADKVQELLASTIVKAQFVLEQLSKARAAYDELAMRMHKTDEQSSNPVSVCHEVVNSQSQLQNQCVSTPAEEVSQQLDSFMDTNEINNSSIIENRQWLQEVKPKKLPYLPQINDHVVYFRQGHEAYLKAVEEKKIYATHELDKPWTYKTLNDREFMRIVEITFAKQPLGLCELKLEPVDDDSKECFSVRFHDMKNVVDFMVLRQSYDKAMTSKRWQKGDSFRCAIDDKWFFGKIVDADRPFQKEFPNSPYKRLLIKWDDDERLEEVSPWELEPVDEKRLPEKHGKTVRVLYDEICATLYQCEIGEWPAGGREQTCNRIVSALKQLEREPYGYCSRFFQLCTDPVYLETAAYPIDLTTIKSRLENRFYRRFAALYFDVDCLRKNLEDVEGKIISLSYTDSYEIVLYKLMYQTVIKIIENPNNVDIEVLHNELQDQYEDYEDDDLTVTQSDSQSEYQPSLQLQSQASTYKDTRPHPPRPAWLKACQRLFDEVRHRDDAESFRTSVNLRDYPDYDKIVMIPMSLFNIGEYLDSGHYKNAKEFDRDMNLIFSNSKQYNTNENSEIYRQTARLQEFYDNRRADILSFWVSPKKSKGPAECKPNGKCLINNEHLETVSRLRKNADDNKAGPSGVQKKHPRVFGRAYFKNDGDSSPNDSDEENFIPGQRSTLRSPAKNCIIDDDDEDEETDDSHTNANRDADSMMDDENEARDNTEDQEVDQRQGSSCETRKRKKLTKEHPKIVRKAPKVEK